MAGPLVAHYPHIRDPIATSRSMTDRLAELRPAQWRSPPSDIESGLDDCSSDLLRPFNREAAAIEKALTWADKQVTAAGTAPPGDTGSNERLDGAEAKFQAIRKRLQRITAENTAFAKENAAHAATVRTRLVRYSKLGQDFGALAGRLAAARAVQRKAAEVALENAVRKAGQAVETDIAGPTQVAVDGDRRAMLENVRARNAEISRLGRSVEELNQTFQDMHILVQKQQGLVNNEEHILVEVALDAEEATDELTKAHIYRRRKRKRRIWCLVLLAIMIALVILGIVLAVTLL